MDNQPLSGLPGLTEREKQIAERWSLPLLRGDMTEKCDRENVAYLLRELSALRGQLETAIANAHTINEFWKTSIENEQRLEEELSALRTRLDEMTKEWRPIPSDGPHQGVWTTRDPAVVEQSRKDHSWMEFESRLVSEWKADPEPGAPEGQQPE